jgi:signal transduction histidine kinase
MSKKPDPLDEPGELVADERVLAGVRLLLSVTSFVSIYVDPTEPTRYVAVAYGLSVLYALQSAGIALALRTATEWPAWAPIATHAADVCWLGALTWVTGAASSPLTPFLTFLVVAAAYRWGSRGTLTTAAVVCVLLVAEALAQTFNTAGPTRVFELNRLIVRTAYTASAGVLLAYLAAYQKQLQLESSTIARLVSKLRSETGIHAALEMAAHDLLHTFAAQSLLIVVRELRTGHVVAWTLSSADQRGFRRVRMTARDSSRCLFDGPTAFALKHRRAGTAFTIAVDSLGKGVAAPSIDEALPLSFSHAIGATLSSYEEWYGRVLLLDPAPAHRDMRGVRLLQRIAASVTPALHSIYLIRRLRSRAEAAERARIARDLHDTSIQSLIAVEMELMALSRRTGDATLRTIVTDIQGRLRAEIRALRRFIVPRAGFEPDATALTQRLTEILAKFQIETGIRTRFVSIGAVSVPLHLGRELQLLVHAALSNVRRHSAASRVDVALERDGDGWLLVIEDDGGAFADGPRSGESAGTPAPWSIRERVSTMGGQLVVRHRGGTGVRLEVRLPPLVVPA